VGQQDGIDFLVMEYLEGQTLAERLEKGALPLDQALRYAMQMADALDKAHRKGIVHRDLKPGNVMVTKGGVKLLDFGLAKLRPVDAVAGISVAATMTSPLTAQGTILGTLHYMAPEQVEGKDADARSDIFSFGALVYEMATGKRAFDGKSAASVMAAILEREPPAMSSLQPLTPRALDHIVKRCLAKDAEDRWQNARDLVLELQAGPEEVNPILRVPSSKRFAFAWIAMAVVALSLVVTVLLVFRTSFVTENPAWRVAPIRFTVSPPAGTALYTEDWGVPFTVSPDGRSIVIVGVSANRQRQLWLRALDSEIAQPIAGTDGAIQPFWSPDNQWIGFVAEDRLKRVRVSGGAPETIASAVRSNGEVVQPIWNPNDVIVFSNGIGFGLSRVSAQGGPVSPVTRLNPARGEVWHFWPQFLKDGRHFFYAALGSSSGIYLTSLDGDEPRRVMEREWNQLSTLGYVSGYVMFVQDAALFAKRFDEASLEFSGETVRILDGIPVSGAGRAPFSVSANGVLAYSPTPVGHSSALKWFRRDGTVTDAVASPARYGLATPSDAGFALAPDNRGVVLSRFNANGSRDIWLRDLLRGSESRLTFDGDSAMPIWAPDGKRIAFASARGSNPPNVFTRVLSGNGEDERRSKSPLMNFPTSWSADGSLIVYESIDPKTKFDLWSLRLENNAQERLPLNTQFNKSGGKLSPDGRWIAYV
jgi:hypothetical protein